MMNFSKQSGYQADTGQPLRRGLLMIATVAVNPSGRQVGLVAMVLVVMMPKVLCRRPMLMRAIRASYRPGHLERQCQ